MEKCGEGEDVREGGMVMSAFVHLSMFGLVYILDGDVKNVCVDQVARA